MRILRILLAATLCLAAGSASARTLPTTPHVALQIASATPDGQAVARLTNTGIVPLSGVVVTFGLLEHGREVARARFEQPVLKGHRTQTVTWNVPGTVSGIFVLRARVLRGETILAERIAAMRIGKPAVRASRAGPIALAVVLVALAAAALVMVRRRAAHS